MRKPPNGSHHLNYFSPTKGTGTSAKILDSSGYSLFTQGLDRSSSAVRRGRAVYGPTMGKANRSSISLLAYARSRLQFQMMGVCVLPFIFVLLHVQLLLLPAVKSYCLDSAPSL